MGAGRRRVMIDLGIDFSEPPKNEGGTSTTSGEPNQVAQPFEEDEEIANRSTKWDDKFHELREYKLAHGHTNVPRRSKRNPGNDALGEWVSCFNLHLFYFQLLMFGINDDINTDVII